jgi:hypothetical protein
MSKKTTKKEMSQEEYKEYEEDITRLSCITFEILEKNNDYIKDDCLINILIKKIIEENLFENQDPQVVADAISDLVLGLKKIENGEKVDIKDKEEFKKKKIEYIEPIEAIKLAYRDINLMYEVLSDNIIILEQNDNIKLDRDGLSNLSSKVAISALENDRSIVWGTSDRCKDLAGAIRTLARYTDNIIETLNICRSIYYKYNGEMKDRRSVELINKLREKAEQKNIKLKENIFDDFFSRLPINHNIDNVKDHIKSWFLSTISVNFNQTFLNNEVKREKFCTPIEYNKALQQLENILIIVGDKSMRKSTLVNHLMAGLDYIAKTTICPNNFTSVLSVDFNKNDDNATRIMSKSGIIFNDELEPINNEIKERYFKNFVSKLEVSHRPLYSEAIEKRGRRAGFISTTNDRLLLHGEATRKRAVIIEFIEPVDSDFLYLLSDPDCGYLYVGALWGYFVDLYIEEYQDKSKKTITKEMQTSLENNNFKYDAADPITTFIQEKLVKRSELNSLIEDEDYFYITGYEVSDVMKRVYAIIKENHPGAKEEYIDKNFRQLISKESEWSYLRKDAKINNVYKIPIRKRKDFEIENDYKLKLEDVFNQCYKDILEYNKKDDFFKFIAEKTNKKIEDIEMEFYKSKILTNSIKRTSSRKGTSIRKSGNYYKICYNKEKFDKLIEGKKNE